MKAVFFLCAYFFSVSLVAQSNLDTISSHSEYAREITVVGRHNRADIHQLPEVVGTSIMAGKRNSLIVVDNVQGNIVTNTMRQVMAKVPGIHVWESDGSGIQIGVAARGLSPNRSWEFNTRQNGYDIAADPFGYPEAYYTPQLQAVQRIQVVRGSGALQYGPQFGGMINFVMRDGSDITKPFQFEGQNTVGSFGLFNAYHAVGGQTGKVHYYAFYDRRQGNGWRENGRYNVSTGFTSVSMQLSKRIKMSGEFTAWHALSQQPGGLTDAQFANNAKQSLRSRNWFDLDWKIGALKFDFDISNKSLLQATVFGLQGNRSSVGFLNNPLIADTINKTTLAYNHRTVAVDEYRNGGAELKFLHRFKALNREQIFTTGIRYFNGTTRRFGNGKGSAGSDADFSITGAFQQQLKFNTANMAAYAEQVINPGNRFKIIPGIRVELIENSVDGQLGISNNVPVKAKETAKQRSRLLAGIGAEYHINKTEVYANFSQAYRPVLFSDLSVNNTTDVVDENLKDASGYNIELGYRGSVKQYLQFDAGIFLMQYNNRIGVLVQTKPDGSSYNFRTNVADSRSYGIETFVEINPLKAWAKNLKYGSFSIFTSAGFTHATYQRFKVSTVQNNQVIEKSYANNRVENAPRLTVRSGINYFYKKLTATVQTSYTSKVYSDAQNTVVPAANGLSGLIPSYHIADASLRYQFSENLNLRAGLNNIFDTKYFTRRAGGYPGPGLMPGEGRNFFVTAGFKL